MLCETHAMADAADAEDSEDDLRTPIRKGGAFHYIDLFSAPRMLQDVIIIGAGKQKKGHSCRAMHPRSRQAQVDAT